MNDVVKFLQDNPVQYLATVGSDNKAKCRPFMFVGELDSKLWFYADNQHEAYKDMQYNPWVEIAVSNPQHAWVRLNGKAVFEENKEAKKMCLSNPIIKEQYKTADNPALAVFYLENSHAKINDFSDNPPKEYSF